MVLLRAADDEDGPDILAVDGAVMVGPTGVLDCLRTVFVECSVVEPFLFPSTEEVVDPAPKDERRELASLRVPNLRVDDIIRALCL